MVATADGCWETIEILDSPNENDEKEINEQGEEEGQQCDTTYIMCKDTSKAISILEILLTKNLEYNSTEKWWAKSPDIWEV